MWNETMGGRRLRFHLAGINNQNFVMRDDETGSWWQQATGEAFAGPLRGSRLRLVFADEVAFAIWRREHPAGRVLRPDASPAWRTWSADWEAKTARLPVVAGVPGADGRGPLPPRALVLGLDQGGAARAYPIASLGGQRVIQDDLGGLPVVILVGDDGRSLRVFESALDGRRLLFFAKLDAAPAAAVAAAATGATAATGGAAARAGAAADAAAPVRHWVDGTSGSEWDFRGRAIAGPWRGRRLRPLPAMKDYWFDWRTYHPRTTVYAAGRDGGGASG